MTIFFAAAFFAGMALGWLAHIVHMDSMTNERWLEAWRAKNGQHGKHVGKG